MSATARATTRPAGHPKPTAPKAGRPRRTPLKEVPPPAPAVAGTGVFSLVVVGILVLGMVMLLVLNTSLASGAFEINDLSSEQRDLAVREQRLVQDVARAEAPESLQQKAQELGMVPVAAPVFLRLSDGAVLGSPRPAQADPTTRIPATGGTGTAPSTSASPAAAATPAPSSAPPTAAATPTGDAAVADPPPVTDGAVLDAPAQPSRENR
ncbi:hypothetical protein [Longivirga aurantiaca]|uniref:Cell division protein FtsL n=1 Tax=Longivirga aurantiaca TaxID=1837743 RepID=A0ABW1T1Y6_9ACTN